MRSRIQPCLTLLLWLSVLGQAGLAAAGDEVPPLRRDRAEESVRQGLTDFAADLAENSVALFSADNVVPFLVAAEVVAASHPVDGRLRTYFDAGDRLGEFEGAVGERAGRLPLVAGTVGGLWALSRFRGDDEFARLSYDLAQAAALTGVLTLGLKQGIGRQRPNGANDLSFPSGHTSSAFAIATVVDRHYGSGVSIAAYAAATFVAVSRLDASKHYLSDVVAGATLGYIVGRTVSRQEDRRANGIAWAPILSPGSRTYGVRFSWDFGD